MSRRRWACGSPSSRSGTVILRLSSRFMLFLITAYTVSFIACMYMYTINFTLSSHSSFDESTARLRTHSHLYVGNGNKRTTTTPGSNYTGWTRNHSTSVTPKAKHSLPPWPVDKYTNRFFWKTDSDSAGFVTFTGGQGRELAFRKNPDYVPSKCPTSIQQKMSANRRGRTIYHPEIHLLMNSNLLNESEYERMSVFFQPFGYKYRQEMGYKDYLSTLKLFPNKSSIFKFPIDDPRPECLSCAVVANGGILKGSGKGAEIDSHRMVFRVNRAIRRRFAKDVGKRTTHYVFYDRSLRETPKADVPRDKGLIYVFLPCRDKDYTYITSVVKGKEYKIKAAAEDIRILHPDFMRYVNKIWVNSSISYRFTTGAIMLMTALHSGCDQVSVYGMGYTNDYSMYYTDSKHHGIAMNQHSHDIKNELAILKGLDRAGVISWYKRDVKAFFTTGNFSS